MLLKGVFHYLRAVPFVRKAYYSLVAQYDWFHGMADASQLGFRSESKGQGLAIVDGDICAKPKQRPESIGPWFANTARSVWDAFLGKIRRGFYPRLNIVPSLTKL